MSDYKQYQFEYLYGRDDLKDPNPYDDYGSFRSAFADITEEWYKENRDEYKRIVERWNDDYIEGLKKRANTLPHIP